MKIKRCFHPVGQGGFFSECHYLDHAKPIVIVYDCGSDNAQPLEEQVAQFGHTEIDYLVISHFHTDHTNGVAKLLKNKIKIKNLVLPNLTQDEIVIQYLKYGAQFDIAAFSNPQIFFNPERIIRVFPRQGGTTEPIVPSGDGPIEISHNTPLSIEHNSPQNPDAGYPRWILKFYVQQAIYSNENFKEVFDKLKNIKPDEITGNQDIADARRKFKQKNEEFNGTSMSMYSGPAENLRHHPHHYWCQQSYSHPYGVLLNGDADFRDKQVAQKLVAHYAAISSHIGDFCIPHHGSEKNLSSPLLDFPYQVAYVQYGLSNHHGHPSPKVIDMHRKQGIAVKKLHEQKKIAVREITLCCYCFEQIC